jgi:hypothetical protein
MKKINKIIIEHIPDYDADLDWIGTFDNEPKSEFAIEHDVGNPQTYSWFNPQNGAVENKKQAKEDYKRMLAYENGDWGMIGIKATAEVYTSQNGREWKIDKITSGGLWGIETDSSLEYKIEVEKDEEADLFETLKEFGFTDKDFIGVVYEYKRN